MLNLCQNENFSFLLEAMYSYNKTEDSLYDSTKLESNSYLRTEFDLLSKCGHNLKKTVSFDDIVHFIDDKNIVTCVDFHRGNIFYPEAPEKVSNINH